MTCHRCGEHTPRLTLSQTRCPRCQREVDATVRPPITGFIPEWRKRLTVHEISAGRPA